MNRLLYGATLSSFRLKFDSKGFGFFDAAVELFEQDRHLKWDIRSHRASARYRMAMFSRCSKQDMWSQHRTGAQAHGTSTRNSLRGHGFDGCERDVLCFDRAHERGIEKVALYGITSRAHGAHKAGTRVGGHPGG